jgi:putative membrane protein
MKTPLAFGLAMVLAAPAFAQAMAPDEYVKTSGASDLYEITSSQTVLESTTDPKVRMFAEMMIKHHTKSTADVKAAAMRAKLRPAPPMLMPAQNEMIAQLRAENGPARDQAYVAQQKASHGQALAVQTAYAQEGTSAPLKMAANKIVPVVKQHIAILKTM